MIAAIYARKSTEQHGVAEDAKSVTRQIEHATAYAAKKGWTVAQDYVYSDDGVSGVTLIEVTPPPPARAEVTGVPHDLRPGQSVTLGVAVWDARGLPPRWRGLTPATSEG